MTAPIILAATLCASHGAMLEFLADKHGEELRGAGIIDTTEGAKVMELMADEADGSWTVIVTNDAGVSCMIAAGTGFVAVAAKPTGDAL